VRVGTSAVVIVRRGAIQKSAVVKVHNQCPFVLMVKAGWVQGKALGTKEDSAMRSGLLRVGCRAKERLRLNLYSGSVLPQRKHTLQSSSATLLRPLDPDYGGTTHHRNVAKHFPVHKM